MSLPGPTVSRTPAPPAAGNDHADAGRASSAPASRELRVLSAAQPRAALLERIRTAFSHFRERVSAVFERVQSLFVGMRAPVSHIRAQPDRAERRVAPRTVENIRAAAVHTESVDLAKPTQSADVASVFSVPLTQTQEGLSKFLVLTRNNVNAGCINPKDFESIANRLDPDLLGQLRKINDEFNQLSAMQVHQLTEADQALVTRVRYVLGEAPVNFNAEPLQRFLPAFLNGKPEVATQVDGDPGPEDSSLSEPWSVQAQGPSINEEKAVPQAPRVADALSDMATGGADGISDAVSQVSAAMSSWLPRSEPAASPSSIEDITKDLEALSSQMLKDFEEPRSNNPSPSLATRPDARSRAKQST